MSIVKKKNVAMNINPSVETRDTGKLAAKTGNLYESLVIIGKRASQIHTEIKEELHAKLEEFAPNVDSLEEVHENREQIEISKAYERLPNPALLALHEFNDNKIYFRREGEE
jgi:DNA-directed RNA polymerase subunit K/omega